MSLEEEIEGTIQAIAGIYIHRPEMMADFLRRVSTPDYKLNFIEERICEIIIEQPQDSLSSQASK